MNGLVRLVIFSMCAYMMYHSQSVCSVESNHETNIRVQDSHTQLSADQLERLTLLVLQGKVVGVIPARYIFYQYQLRSNRTFTASQFTQTP